MWAFDEDSPRVSLRKRRRPTLASEPSKPRQRPTLPQGCPCSTIGPEELNFRVRDGNGCDLSGVTARKKHETKCEGWIGIQRSQIATLVSCDDRATNAIDEETSVIGILG